MLLRKILLSLALVGMTSSVAMAFVTVNGSVDVNAVVAETAVEGYWDSGMEMDIGEGVTLKLYLGFKGANASAIARCERGSDFVVATASAPFKIEGENIELLGDSSAEASERGLSCEVAVEAGVMTFSMDGNDVLKLKDPVEGFEMDLSRTTKAAIYE